MRRLIVTTFCVVSCATLRADFTYQETTQMTGGTLVTLLRLGGPFTRKAREPIVSTVMIKGNRMATSSKENATIIDLDKETITEIDLGKKTYSVMTFAQMRQAMENAMEAAQEKQKQQKGAPKGNVDAKFKVSAKSTGQTKTVQGLSAKQMLVTMELEGTDKDTGNSGSMTVIDDAWMANVPGYDEVKAFHLKMAQKMAYTVQPELSRMAMSDPRMMQGLAEASKEMAKVDGVPVQTVVKMGMGITAENTASDSGGQQKQEKAKGGGLGEAAAGAIAGRIGIGGFGRNRNKNKEAEPAPAADQKQGSSGSALLMEMTTEMTSFSSGSVDASKFEVPGGFKQVESDLVKRTR